MLVIVSGCGGQAPAIEQSSVEILRPVYNVITPPHERWCYGDVGETTGEGICADERVVCDEDRRGRINFYVTKGIEHLTKLRDSGQRPELAPLTEEKITEINQTIENGRWTQCEVAQHAACFSARKVVSGDNFELCYPSMKWCNYVENNNRRDPDVSVTSGCSVR